MTRALFTYGTLMVDAVIEKVVAGRAFDAAPATLAGYRRFGLVDEVFPGIVPAPGHHVDGRVFFDLDAPALARLDDFEDVIYAREIADVRTEQGALPAFIYVVTPEYRHLLSNRDWDLDTFRRRHLEKYLKGIF